MIPVEQTLLSTPKIAIVDVWVAGIRLTLGESRTSRRSGPPAPMHRGRLPHHHLFPRLVSIFLEAYTRPEVEL